MRLRKAFIFRGGSEIIIDDKPISDKPLAYLDNSLSKLKETLETYGNWNVESFTLKSSDDISDKLHGIEDSEDNEILLFYTGHGVPQLNNRYALIKEDGREVVFDNIINPINKFSWTKFILIIDACHSEQIQNSIFSEENIEAVSSISKGLAYEDSLFESSNFVHYFINAIKNSTLDAGEDITLEYICDSIFKNNHLRKKPIRIPPKHTKYTDIISIAKSTNGVKNQPVPNAKIEFPTGHVPLGSLYYVKREDKKVHNYLLKDNALISIKAPRQYGKTSLLSRVLKESKDLKYQVVALSFQELEEDLFENLDILLSFLREFISLELHIEPTNNMKNLNRFTPKIITSKYIEAILSQLDTSMALIIDEVDIIFKYKHLSNEFFSLIRTWNDSYPSRNSIWKKLKIILSYSTEPLLSIRNINQSPFNTGLRMKLRAFNFEEIKELATLHNLTLTDNEVKKIQDYLGGHPYLIRKIFYDMVDEKIELSEVLVNSRFDEHLRRYLILFNHNPRFITTIKNVIEGNFLDIENCYILESTGFIINSMHNIKFSCRLYQEFFEEYFS